MKLLLVFAIVAGVAFLGGSAGAQNYPWCSNFADGAGTNCGFATLQQCTTTIQGSGGYCDRNTQYRPPAVAAPASRKTSKSSSRNPS
jgi:hypothetical protein